MFFNMLNSNPLYHYVKFQLYSIMGASQQTMGRVFVDSALALGSVFTKFGQLESNRSELHPAFIRELKVLQDKVPPSETVDPPAGIRLTELCASGTVAMVYRGETKDRQQVAVKLKRKNIDALFKKDLATLKWYLDWYLYVQHVKQSVCNLFTNNTRAMSKLHVEKRELFKTFDTIANLITTQTNFVREAKMMDVFQDIYGDNPHIKIPHHYKELSNNDCIVMEYIDGERLDHIPKEQLAPIYQTFVEFVVLTPLMFNICHGDLHLGNIMALGQQLVVLDFGIVYELEDDEMTDLFDLLETASTQNVDQMANVVLRAFINPDDVKFVDIPEFKKDLKIRFDRVYKIGFQLKPIAEEIQASLQVYDVDLCKQFKNIDSAFSASEGAIQELNPDKTNMWGVFVDIIQDVTK